jgi:hypothetical protein
VKSRVKDIKAFLKKIEEFEPIIVHEKCNETIGFFCGIKGGRLYVRSEKYSQSLSHRLNEHYIPLSIIEGITWIRLSKILYIQNLDSKAFMAEGI